MYRAAMILFGTVIAFSWGAMGYDMMRHNDDHAFKIMHCMQSKRKALDISTEEAYILCEKESR